MIDWDQAMRSLFSHLRNEQVAQLKVSRLLETLAGVWHEPVFHLDEVLGNRVIGLWKTPVELGVNLTHSFYGVQCNADLDLYAQYDRSCDSSVRNVMTRADSFTAILQGVAEAFDQVRLNKWPGPG